MKLKFNFNKRNRYKNICSIEGCNNSACGKYCNKHYHQIKRYGNIKTRTRFDKNEIIINDNVAKILLYNNDCNVIDYTIIDVEDINKISKYKISKCGNYAYANINNKNVALHRIITNTVDEWCQISSDGTCQNRRKGDVFKEPDGSIHYNGAFSKRATDRYSFNTKEYLNIKVMGRRFYGFNNRFRTTKNTEAIVFENGGFVGNLGLVKKTMEEIY